ncbi:MAG: SgcJ/EcaC family oxidoreductase [Planctomycetia bacterium]|nr:SgcJ/EcaC family oxidoreductase [Planctomycetia bacterium]
MGAEQDLRDMIAAWIRAVAEDDVETLAALAAPDVVFLAPGRAPVEGRDAWLTVRDRPIHGVETRCEPQQVRAYGDAGHAWFDLRLRIPAAQGASEVRIEGHLLALYRRDAAGQWRLAREARMLAPGK